MKLFNNRKPRNNEECAAFLKEKSKVMYFMCMFGVITILFAIWSQYGMKLTEASGTWNLYMGLGCGLCAVAVFNIIKNHRISKDEKRLKAYRIMITDEREEMILGKAFRMAGFVVLIMSYIGALIGSIWIPHIIYILAVQVVIMVIAYIVFYRVYSREN